MDRGRSFCSDGRTPARIGLPFRVFRGAVGRLQHRHSVCWGSGLSWIWFVDEIGVLHVGWGPVGYHPVGLDVRFFRVGYPLIRGKSPS